MATQNVCTWNKYGYCRYGEECRKLHVNELCVNIACEHLNCKLRHPATCKYYSKYNRCKFNPCAFKHEENEIQNLKRENLNLLDKLNAIDRDIKVLNDKENESKMLIEKMNILEKNVEKFISEKDIIINSLVEKIQVLEKKCYSKMFKHEKKMDFFTKKLSYVIGMSSDEEETTDIDEKHSESLNSLDTETENIVKCEKCDFETISEHELKVHQEVNHSNSSYCEICNFKAQTKSDLEVHVFTCELYRCSKCEFKSRRLSQIKNHLRKEHGSVEQNFHHLKMDRNEQNKVCDTVHSLEDI